MSGGMEAAAIERGETLDELLGSPSIRKLIESAPDLGRGPQDYEPDAVGFLLEAADTISNRASERDHDDGERSMARTVAMFNAWRGHGGGPLTETDGWSFMVFLKLARARGGTYKRDDFVDGAAYLALAGESAEPIT